MAEEPSKVVEENGLGGAHGLQEGGASTGDHEGRDRKAVILVRKADVAQAILRLLSVATSVTALMFMVTAKENSIVFVYGFPLPVYSKWSFSDSFE